LAALLAGLLLRLALTLALLASLLTALLTALAALALAALALLPLLTALAALTGTIHVISHRKFSASRWIVGAPPLRTTPAGFGSWFSRANVRISLKFCCGWRPQFRARSFSNRARAQERRKLAWLS
jgi:hypothetical protein